MCRQFNILVELFVRTIPVLFLAESFHLLDTVRDIYCYERRIIGVVGLVGLLSVYSDELAREERWRELD